MGKVDESSDDVVDPGLWNENEGNEDALPKELDQGNQGE